MLNDVQTGTYGRDLLIAAAAAAERLPQLADEIRAHTRHLAGRVSAGGRLHPGELDVRTLVGLIEQSGVPVPPGAGAARLSRSPLLLAAPAESSARNARTPDITYSVMPGAPSGSVRRRPATSRSWARPGGRPARATTSDGVTGGVGRGPVPRPQATSAHRAATARRRPGQEWVGGRP